MFHYEHSDLKTQLLLKHDLPGQQPSEHQTAALPLRHQAIKIFCFFSKLSACFKRLCIQSPTMRTTLLILSLFLPLAASAQHFEWASSGSNFFTGYSHSAMTPDGHLLAGGNYSETGGSFGNIEMVSSGGGKSFSLYGRRGQFFVCNYNDRGEIVWMLSSAEYLGGGILLGLSSLPNGNSVIAFRTSHLSRPFTRSDQTVSKQTSERPDDYGNYILETDRHRYTFFAVIDPRGQIGAIHAIAGITYGECHSFTHTPDGGFLMGIWDDIRATDQNGVQREMAHNFVYKISGDFKKQWEHKVKWLDNSCCSWAEPSCKAVVSPYNGDIYVAGYFRWGIIPDGGEKHMAPEPDSITIYNEPEENYLMCLSQSGTLKWITYSGGKSRFNDISTDGNRIILGGYIINQDTLFGVKVDTTQEKRAYLASFTTGGKIKWMQTFNAAQVSAVAQDEQGQVFAAFKSDRPPYKTPLKIGTDTISDTNNRVVVGSFDARGKYRWYKYSRAYLNSVQPQTRLLTDNCGNLFITAEMHYGLPVNMSIFDAALVSCRGYGGAPLAAKIRTNIPDEVLALNAHLVVSLNVRVPVQLPDPKPLPAPPIVSPPRQGPQPDTTSTTLAAIDDTDTDSVPNIRQGCSPIPFPWSMVLMPNPSSGQFTARATISFSDNKVRIDLWNARGGFVRNLMPEQLKEAGTFDFPVDISDLPSGLYFIVLRGSGGSAVNERLVLAR